MTATIRAAKNLNSWLQTCKELGWPKEAVPDLVDLWWLYHDDEGNLYPPGKVREPDQSRENT